MAILNLGLDRSTSQFKAVFKSKPLAAEVPGWSMWHRDHGRHAKRARQMPWLLVWLIQDLQRFFSWPSVGLDILEFGCGRTSTWGYKVVAADRETSIQVPRTAQLLQHTACSIIQQDILALQEPRCHEVARSPWPRLGHHMPVGLPTGFGRSRSTRRLRCQQL